MNSGISKLILLQADKFFNPCKGGDLFSEKLQIRRYIQTSQLITHTYIYIYIYKKW